MYDDYDDFRFRRYEEKSTVSHFQIMKHFTKLIYFPLPSWSVLKESALTWKTSAALPHVHKQ
jgi:hypothetical protein